MDIITKLLLCLLLVFGITGCAQNEDVVQNYEEDTYRRVELDGKKYKYNTHLVNFLILGTDTVNDAVGHSDFVGLLIFDRQNERVEFLTISRNAYIPIKTYDANGDFVDWSSNYLALSYSYGEDTKSASYLTADAVSRLLNDIPMTYVASMNLSGIVQIHDVVGTLDVVVPDDSLVYVNEKWKAGTQITLTSENVEDFVRMRDVSEDFTNTNRMTRQKTYLLAYVNQLKALLESDFVSTSAQLEDVLSLSFTNFDLSEVEAFADMLMNYQWDENSFHELPGSEEKGMFHDKFIVDEEALDRLLVNLFYIEK